MKYLIKMSSTSDINKFISSSNLILFTGYTINKVLCSLEALDKLNFDKSAAIDTLYHKIFDQNSSKSTDSQVINIKLMSICCFSILCFDFSKMSFL